MKNNQHISDLTIGDSLDWLIFRPDLVYTLDVTKYDSNILWDKVCSILEPIDIKQFISTCKYFYPQGRNRNKVLSLKRLFTSYMKRNYPIGEKHFLKPEEVKSYNELVKKESKNYSYHLEGSPGCGKKTIILAYIYNNDAKIIIDTRKELLTSWKRVCRKYGANMTEHYRYKYEIFFETKNRKLDTISILHTPNGLLKSGYYRKQIFCSGDMYKRKVKLISSVKVGDLFVGKVSPFINGLPKIEIKKIKKEVKCIGIDGSIYYEEEMVKESISEAIRRILCKDNIITANAAINKSFPHNRIAIADDICNNNRLLPFVLRRFVLSNEEMCPLKIYTEHPQNVLIALCRLYNSDISISYENIGPTYFGKITGHRGRLLDNIYCPSEIRKIARALEI